MVSSKFCPSCKQTNSSLATECIHCGAVLETNRPGFISTTMRIAQEQPGLFTEAFRQPRRLIELPLNVLALLEPNSPEPFAKSSQAKVVLGRGSGETGDDALIDLTPLAADQFGVSRRHALIIRSEDGYAIQDLNSTNGTWVNEFRLVPDQTYPLYSEAFVRLGQLTLQVQFRTQAAPDVILLVSEATHTAAAARTILTTNLLGDTLSPFLDALADVQHLLVDNADIPSGQIRINAINAFKPDAPIVVSLTGAHEAVELVRTWLNPWRSANAQRLAVWAQSPAASAEVEQSPSQILNAELAALALQIAGRTFATASEAFQHQRALALVAPLQELVTNQLRILEETISAGSTI